MATPPRKNNLMKLAGVINSANREGDDEAGALIERVRKNHRRTLGLIAKGHANESLRELTLAEAEREQINADLAAAVGDNGEDPLDQADEQAREALRNAKKSSAGSDNQTREADGSEDDKVTSFRSGTNG